MTVAVEDQVVLETTAMVVLIVPRVQTVATAHLEQTEASAHHAKTCHQ
jgi:hypothetical protein